MSLSSRWSGSPRTTSFGGVKRVLFATTERVLREARCGFESSHRAPNITATPAASRHQAAQHSGRVFKMISGLNRCPACQQGVDARGISFRGCVLQTGQSAMQPQRRGKLSCGLDSKSLSQSTFIKTTQKELSNVDQTLQ